MSTMILKRFENPDEARRFEKATSGECAAKEDSE